MKHQLTLQRHKQDISTCWSGKWGKGARPYFSKFSFLFHLKNHHSKDVKVNLWLKRSSHLDIYDAILYIAVRHYLTLYNYVYHNQAFFHLYLPNRTRISYMSWVMRKIWALLWYQNLQKFFKSLKIGLGSFKYFKVFHFSTRMLHS